MIGNGLNAIKIMRIAEIVELLELKVCSGAQGLANEVDGGYASDLLSDVMGNAQAGSVWITLQTHKNIMAVAGLKDLAAIVLVKGLEPDEDTAAHSNDEGIPILSTPLEAFAVAGKLYGLLNR